MTLVGQTELIEEDWFSTGRGRAEHADVIDGFVSAWIAGRDRAEVLAGFEKVGGAVAPVYSARDIVEDEHIRETKMLVNVDDADLGSMLMHNVMWRMSKTPGSIRFTGRPLGADTDEILTDQLGYTPTEITALRNEGVVA